MINLLAQVDLAHAVSNTVADGGIDINQIAQLSNGNPMMVVALGAIAAFGGKKGWDWLKQRQEQKHEEKLAAIEAQKVSIPAGTGHEQCVAKQETLEAQVQVLRTKINEVNQKATDSEKAAKEIVEKQKQEVSVLDEEVKKLKKKVKKIKEDLEDQEEERSRKKSKKRRDDDE